MAETYTAKKLHTPSMVHAEALAVLRLAPAPTLRQMMLLAMGGSPYLIGGDPDEEHTALARQVLDMPDASPARIAEMVATALRPLECIVPSGGSGREGGGSELPDWSPEWLAEVISIAAHALPSLGWNEALDMPAALMAHLVLAGHRRRGGVTRRPDDEAAAMAWLMEQEGNANA